MKKYLNTKSMVIALVLSVFVFIGVAYAAVQSRSGLNTTNTTNLATGSNITATDLRAVVTNLIDSQFNLTDDDISDISGLSGVSTAEVVYLDIATLGTGAESKSVVLNASGDYTFPSTGNLIFPSSSTLDLNSGSVILVDSATVNHNALAYPGRATIWICGDAVTVNNNTVYYGPSQVVAANAGRVCDITQAGSITEATADAPAFTDTAFHVLSWYCLQPDAGADLTYTLRANTAALTPANAMTIVDNALSKTSTTATTTIVPSGATFDIAVSSTADVGTVQFACAINVAF